MTSPGKTGAAIRRLPSALERRDEIAERIGDRTPALFLDYDGTLTPIVEDPAEAAIPAETRDVLRTMAEGTPVAVISGRDLDEVRRMVGVGGLWYAGSHGFDLAGPQGDREQRATDAVPALDEAEEELRRTVEAEFPGARVERKRFALAVHYRTMDPQPVPDLRRRVEQVAADHPELRVSGGKKIFEVRPDEDWDKGRAVLWLWDVLDLRPASHHAIYIGDDVTDEDVFRVLGDRLPGTGIVVRGEDDGRESRADYSLADPGEVRAFLDLISTGGAER